MNIKTKLQIVGILPVVSAVIIGVVVFSTRKQINEAIEQDRMAGEIVMSVFHKTTVRDEYLLKHEERARMQWYSEQGSIESLLVLASLTFKGKEKRVILDAMSRAHTRTGELFSLLVTHFERPNPGEIPREFNERIVGQLLISSESIISDAFRLERATHERLLSAQRKANMLIIAALVLLAGGIGVVSLLIGRRVAKHMKELHEATEIIAGGNLNYEIPVESHDEIGQLTRAFNEMTGNLRKSYEALGQEIEVRKVAEEELKQYQEHLEELVEKRTAELQCANEQLHHEITERKKAEEEIKKLNEDLRRYVTQLEAAIKELEAFSYSVSHDLRAPLRAIDGFSKILLDGWSKKLDDEGRRLLTIVGENTKKMGQLIDDILAFSRVGRTEVQVTRVNVEELAKGVFDELSSTASGRKLQIMVGKLPPGRGDAAMIRQILFNLISNAMKFTEPRDTAVIEVGGFDKDVENVYYVKDNGVGFDMQYAHKLFGVFQRLHSAEEFEGTGIGLAIVNRIITKHGGRVWAEGKVNEGATFFFSLPETMKPDSQSCSVSKQGGTI